MNIILRRHLHYPDKLLIGTTNGFVHLFMTHPDKIKTSGSFYNEDELYMIFAYQSDIYLYYNNSYLNFAKSDAKVSIDMGKETNTIYFYVNGALDHSYTYEKVEPVVGNPFYTEDLYDADFFYWIYRVLNDKEKLEGFRLNN